MTRYPRESAASRGYGARWRKASKIFLARNPFCRYCEEAGRKWITATLVDHIIPHRGNQELFWDENNWASSCKPCHDGMKQQQEKSGTIRGCHEDGTPLDPGHHWSSDGAAG